MSYHIACGIVQSLQEVSGAGDMAEYAAGLAAGLGITALAAAALPASAAEVLTGSALLTGGMLPRVSVCLRHGRLV